MVCGGDSTQYCGDGDRLELYLTTSGPPTSTTTAIPSPTHVEAVGDYALVGCWTEISGGGRALSQKARIDEPEMTNELCASVCEGYRYFATEYSQECYCGSHVSQHSESAPLEECGMTCGGDASSFCGGPSRLELYLNPDIAGGQPEQPLGAGDFAFVGCRRELAGQRALSGKATAGDDMTNEKCAAFCGEYEFFGTEYGAECYCGDELPEEAEEAAAGECEMLCAGSVLEYCGAGNRLSVYQKKEEEIVEG